ncbi:MAG: polysaccharide biosynthesis C-terminal domain-containing protein [Terriglobales bacterium]
MRKLEKIQLLKNIGSSWFSLGVNVLVGIFLSPFIMHRLGDSAFGIWVLIFSITGYYGIFDLGIRSSIIRYVSKYTATKEMDRLARHLNTSLATYTGIGIVSMAATVVLSLYVDRLFKIPPAMHAQARLLLLLVGASVSLGFPLGVSGGILEGLQRYYLLNWTAVVMSLSRAALIVFFLNRGYGLITIALITIVLPIITAVVRAFLAYHMLPLPYGLKYVDRVAFHHMASFSGATMLVIVASRLRFQTDEMVIGSMLSAAAITYFSIGARIMDYAFQVVVTLAQLFIPMSSQSEALGNMDRVRKLYIAGNRACALATFPIIATVLILGKSIIEVWVGRKYVALSFPVLVTLAIPMTLLMMQAASSRILMGMGRHRQLATVALIEGVGNLILSIALVRPLGIVGDALGTAIPLACTMLYFTPRHMRRQLGVPVRTFLREAYMLPLLLVLPFTAVLLLMRSCFYAHHLWQLAVQVGAGGLVYGLGLLWAHKTNRVLRVGKLVEKSSEPVEVQPVPTFQNGYGDEV